MVTSLSPGAANTVSAGRDPPGLFHRGRGLPSGAQAPQGVRKTIHGGGRKILELQEYVHVIYKYIHIHTSPGCPQKFFTDWTGL